MVGREETPLDDTLMIGRFGGFWDMSCGLRFVENDFAFLYCHLLYKLF